MAENTVITSKARARQANMILRATSTGSFQGACIPSVTSHWSCAKTDRSNCCSRETLFLEPTCEFERYYAVNDALDSGVGKHLLVLMSGGTDFWKHGFLEARMPVGTDAWWHGCQLVRMRVGMDACWDGCLLVRISGGEHI